MYAVIESGGKQHKIEKATGFPPLFEVGTKYWAPFTSYIMAYFEPDWK